jgi:hypothetical protein
MQLQSTEEVATGADLQSALLLIEVMACSTDARLVDLPLAGDHTKETRRYTNGE